MTYHTLSSLFFTLGSIILVIFSLLSMIIHKYTDGYSILYDRMSYSGIRHDFEHPIRGTLYQKSRYPEILNFSIFITGTFYLLGFILFTNWYVKITGGLFAILVMVIGAVDVSTNYHLHNKSVFFSQPTFLLMLLGIMVMDFDFITLITFVVILCLILINLHKKSISNNNPGKQVNVIWQKLFIYIEAIYLVFV